MASGPAAPRHRYPAAGLGSSADSVAYFDYELPADRIAQEPVEPRDAARLLVERPSGVDHRRISDLPGEVGAGDVVVVNDTRVMAARLLLAKPTGGRVEVLLLRPTGPALQWEALIRSGRRVRPGTELLAGGDVLVVAGGELGDGRRLVELVAADAMDRAGRIPLPPYIRRELADDERYQTVFANRPGSVAAPTAGLHLTPEVLDRIEARGADIVRIELEVGLGTFRPVATERVAEHRMHAEAYRVEPEAWRRIIDARRVVAVGTTVVRALESVAVTGELAGTTDLFIRRGFAWRVVDRLLTNFHLPRSSLLVLLDAFVGPRWVDLYATALASGYRFLSFGDAMLVDRHPVEAGRP